MIAGYFGGIVDDIINRTSEAVRVIPQIVFAIALCAVFGGGILNLAIVLGISNTTVYIRMMRSQVLSIKERDYIMAGKLQGNSNFRLMSHHILPNSISPIIVTMTPSIALNSFPSFRKVVTSPWTDSRCAIFVAPSVLITLHRAGAGQARRARRRPAYSSR